jgi:hypothetical protein
MFPKALEVAAESSSKRCPTPASGFPSSLIVIADCVRMPCGPNNCFSKSDDAIDLWAPSLEAIADLL